MKPDSIVVVSLHSPQERFFGRLLDISTSGITVRGIDLHAFEDWISNIQNDEETGVRPATTFFPLLRVDRIVQDEAIGAIPSFGDAFFTKVGASVSKHLE